MGKRALAPTAPGGHRQKARWADGAESVASAQSALAHLLITKWSVGEVSAPSVQSIAKAAVTDGANHPELRSLAALGSEGLYPGNIHNELSKKIRKVPIAEAMIHQCVWVKRHALATTQVEHPMILPHMLFSTLYHKNPEAFMLRVLGGSASNLPKFWTDMRGHPNFEGHPVRGRDGFAMKAVPIAIHGDGVPVSGIGRARQRSCDIFSWSGLLGKGPTTRTTFLVYLIYTSLIIRTPEKDVYALFSRIFAWSLYWLWMGVWPGKNWDDEDLHDPRAGTPLADGLFGVLWVARGDLEFMAKAFGFPWFSSASPCICCQANQNTTPWTDPHTNAAWRSTIWNRRSWCQAFPERHPVFRLPGVSVLTYYPDVLHTMHLGVWQRFFGSVLQYLVAHIMGESPAKNMEQAWENIQAHYQAGRSSFYFM